jgi:DNA-binding NtrC family response regulator
MEGTLLIADSDTEFMDAVVHYFLGRQFAVSAFGDFDAAMKSITHDHYDIAIVEFCDARVRENLFAELPRRTPGIALILTCGNYTHQLEIQARSLSPAFFFVKPFELSDLYAVVVRLIETKDRQTILSQQRALHREGATNE